MVFKIYYPLRIFLRKKKWLLRCSQVIRNWWILGPWRQHAIKSYQRGNHNRPLQTDGRNLFPELEVEEVVHSLNEKGYSLGVKVPEEYVARILQYCGNTGLMRYWNPHNECDAIDAIARNAKIVEIARRYLGTEPILWLTQLKWSFGSSAKQRKILLSRHKEPLMHDDNAFHHDALDFKSLTVFIYLTDVEYSSGPHVVIEGTNANKSFADICHIVVTDTIVRQKFGDRIKVILGQKGSMFFEETSSYHKASTCQTERLMLSIDYVLRRPPPPERKVIAEPCLAAE